MNGFLATLTIDQMERLRIGLANRAFQWFEKDAVLEMIENMRGREKDMDMAYLKLKRAQL
jgi:hypothetical protein